MIVATQFAGKTLDEVKTLLDGGVLKIYSVARPSSPDHAVDRSGILVEFVFQTPAFGPVADGMEQPLFAADAMPAQHVGTPGFARAFAADGTAIADFSAGPGKREIKFAEVSCSEGAPVRVVKFQILPEGTWPERLDYYNAHPRAGYSLPAIP